MKKKKIIIELTKNNFKLKMFSTKKQIIKTKIQLINL